MSLADWQIVKEIQHVDDFWISIRETKNIAGALSVPSKHDEEYIIFVKDGNKRLYEFSNKSTKESISIKICSVSDDSVFFIELRAEGDQKTPRLIQSWNSLFQ